MNAIRTPMYDENAAVAALNHVEGFDPKQYMRTTSTEEGQGLYLDVKYRKLWFRLAHPLGKIKKIFHALNAEVAICEARVYLNKDDPEDQYIGSGTAQRFFKAGDKFGESYVESAETAAVGRALAEAGFGSQFSDCDVTEPADTTLADAPVAAAASAPAASPAPAGPMAGRATPTAAVSTARRTPAPAPTAATPPVQEPALTPGMPFEQAYAAMTLDKAKAVLIDCGCYRGQTLGQLALTKPASLHWYVDSYKGNNNLLRAAAKYLLDRAVA
ncbi:MAG TPA: hypothetical protein H9915_00950 [Candidatus Gemmiger faecigallinarum]|nr:hypothetical protein [Candidatus Gemmiger faecigallinarum]